MMLWNGSRAGWLLGPARTILRFVSPQVARSAESWGVPDRVDQTGCVMATGESVGESRWQWYTLAPQPRSFRGDNFKVYHFRLGPFVVLGACCGYAIGCRC